MGMWEKLATATANPSTLNNTPAVLRHRPRLKVVLDRVGKITAPQGAINTCEKKNPPKNCNTVMYINITTFTNQRPILFTATFKIIVNVFKQSSKMQISVANHSALRHKGRPLQQCNTHVHCKDLGMLRQCRYYRLPSNAAYRQPLSESSGIVLPCKPEGASL